MHLLRTGAALAVLLLALAACGGGAPATDGGGALEATPTAAPADGGDGGGAVAASVELMITGGEFAGSYSGSVPDGGCSRGATGENTFGLQYSTADETVDFSSVQLIVNDAAAAAGGTDNFMTTVTMGSLAAGNNLDINPPEGQGSGTVTVNDQGGTATIQIEGETADGIGIQVSVTCNSVLDFGA